MFGPMPQIDVATITYRRANGSQVAVSKPRVVRASKTFPRAHTPSPAARKLANLKRRGLVCKVDDCVQFSLLVGGTCAAHKHSA